QLDDAVIEVDLTPNRGDCLSVMGVAREVGVLTGTRVETPALPAIPARIDTKIGIALNAPHYCPRYAGRAVCNVDVSVPTPLWMREKLRRAGLRSIDPVVDVTNYVMLELGQPLHAFDLDKIAGDINVRKAEQGEKITLLDNSEIELDPGLLVIADTQQPLAVAGIMGGASSAVSASTRHVLLESAFFVPEQHAGKARQLGMHTDSSHRFERGVDCLGQQRAIERATELLLAITGGEAGPVQLVEAGPARGQQQVELRASQIKRVLGFEIPGEDVNDMLSRLDFTPRHIEGGWQITVPPHRFDIALEADLLEELARIYGYERLPVEPPLAPMTFSLKPESRTDVALYRQQLVARGYREAITYSFIDPKLHQQFFADAAAVELANPIASDMSLMRTSLLPGLVQAAQYNLSRQQKRLQLFETGLRFVLTARGNAGSDSAALEQEPMLAALLCGERQPESWMAKSEAVQAPGQKPDRFDFYDIKGDVESILALAARDTSNLVEFKAINASDALAYLHPGQSAQVLRGGQPVGVVGLLHPELQHSLDLDQDIWVFELQLNLISEKKVPEFKELSKFPEVRRDLAIIVDQSVQVGDVLACARRAAREALSALVVFDRYSGEGVGEGKQSIGLGLTWQHPARTLQDDEVATLTNEVVTALQEQFDASLR
ncbi:MAG: phenylalanine--tRNA ligase subunit beta, partial [Gammaproteobacteria bacterium]|nr:phenylalanine--tRNA ligase subunit beta [Gammaproteobacteria bacterium]